MQLTKLYSRMVRLIAEESVNIDAILTTLEDTKEKMLDVIQLLEDLVVMYKKNGDKQNLARTEEEIDKVAKDTDKEISRVKDFLASRTKKAPIGSASSEIDFEDEKAPKPKKTYELPVSRVDRNLERIRLPKFNGDKTKFEYFWATFESIVDEAMNQLNIRWYHWRAVSKEKQKKQFRSSVSPKKPTKRQKIHRNVDLEEKEDNFRIISKM